MNRLANWKYNYRIETPIELKYIYTHLNSSLTHPNNLFYFHNSANFNFYAINLPFNQTSLDQDNDNSFLIYQ